MPRSSWDLSQLQFGSPAAERDITNGLDDYFIESDAYASISQGDKRILLGNRGAGKSAIFKVLAARERLANNIVIELAPEDYSYQMFSGVLAGENEGSWVKAGAYAAAWKYLLLVMIMKHLARNAKVKNRTSAEEKRMFRYLRDNHADFAQRPTELLISYIKRMEALKIGKYEAGIRTRELTRLYKLEEFEPFIPIIKGLARRGRVSVFIDELDQGWDASEDAKGFVAGLFQACLYINRLDPNLRVFVSLRQELYENIPTIYDDTQKYRDLFEHLYWDQDQLFRLITHRIKFFVPQLRLLSDEQCWKAAFVEPRSFSFIVERTLYRPREVISYAADALDYARKVGRTGPIPQDILRDVEPRYSKDRMSDLVSEYRFQFPGLGDVLSKFYGKRLLWTRAELEDECIDMALDEKLASRAPWIQEREPDSLIDVLWRVGFLRVKVRNPASSGLHGKILSGSLADPTVSVGRATEFQINSLFKAALSLHV